MTSDTISAISQFFEDIIALLKSINIPGTYVTGFSILMGVACFKVMITVFRHFYTNGNSSDISSLNK